MDDKIKHSRTAHPHRAFYRHLFYVQAIFAILFGILFGHFWPDLGVALKPLSDAFIKLLKMIIAPVIFLTIVGGIAGMALMSAINRFMSECRALINLTGNAVDCFVVARWENELDENLLVEKFSARRRT